MTQDTWPGIELIDEPLPAHTITLEEAAEPQATVALAPAVNPLHAVDIRLQACVGEVVLTVGELLGAREQAVLPVDRTLDAPVDLLLNGRVVARGQLVAVEDRFAVRVTELPLPLGI
ncbi:MULTISPECIES: FliM/FliN family flagellar motor switch protein [Ramlibacter]|uniref:Flagellar motor switch protein n=1 Tax=Ramlibacter pinisoli TaxID=2682844 RepID=A0A6N8IU86_9BURK|nr:MULTISPECIES: FliM/FliN family flagellar motor switch protein [Ramlibacter]MBA2964775.1 FliM/FliN family flagellar motor switch protein [Ramlibacter sp. CGMCC 1.13660]MVQ29740.1 flagellar motor switch protein [Ramlibacter pinisoli]